MKLYHGSDVPNLHELKPFASNHDKPYAYLSTSDALALLYAHNAIKRPGGFFPYWFDKEGLLHYDEYFPDQTRLLYQGQAGWVYTAEADGLTQLEKMPWVYVAEESVQVAKAEYFPDLYEALLQADRDGRLKLHRYESLTEQQHEKRRCIVRESLKTHGEDDYRCFIREHMPEIGA